MLSKILFGLGAVCGLTIFFGTLWGASWVIGNTHQDWIIFPTVITSLVGCFLSIVISVVCAGVLRDLLFNTETK